MPNKKVAEVVETLAAEPVTAEPITLEALAKMKADAEAANRAYREAKAAMPKQSKLEIVLEHQSHGVTDKRARDYFAGLLRSRIKAGQDRETAMSAVVEMFTDFLNAAVANE